MWQFTEAIDGIGEACTALETPITGGNVSFYNETLGNPIYPTPIIGVLGLMEDAEFAIGSGFRNAGDKIFVLDGAADKNIASAESFSSSEYAKEIHGIVSGMPPKIDLAAEKRLIDCLVHLAAEKTIASAHDISDGGVAVSLAESCFGSENLSAQVSLDTLGLTLNAETAAYGERGARAVVSVPPSSVVRLRAIAAENGVNATEIGTVAAGDFRIQYGTKTVIQGSLASFHRPWAKSLQEAIENG
jgi:phosphoribosylformylglycinamidine synthase